ncbi:flavin reductase family protein [Novosphingobium colocasiae]|uniref:Flavin oxidoreductase n=1 Tax=Novosphingobium colocasiae TaxID=1256513 RepID=A0A918UCL2_9SPHN|nr:flavin reductase family protein [Novosphingobium colocasiae]GGY89885.1 flavin oxidoreductase [Novosphingobium colocasiae]
MTIAEEMRLGLRRLAKAVVVITCVKDGQRHAMAATAVSELSMDPPSLLICVNKTASMAPILSGGADFAVNILHSSHAEISQVCSGREKGEARFETGAWETGATGVPVLQDAQASFECKQTELHEYGTHYIVIGDVMAVKTSGITDPLIYAEGVYGRLADCAA